MTAEMVCTLQTTWERLLHRIARWSSETSIQEMDEMQLKDLGLHGMPDAMLLRNGIQRRQDHSRAFWIND